MDLKNDIFISYYWLINPQIEIIDKKLTDLGYQVWKSVNNSQSFHLPLSRQLTDAIKNSKVIICCITRDYCRSFNCNLEINFAHEIKKNLIILMLENIKSDEFSDINVEGRGYNTSIGFIIG